MKLFSDLEKLLSQEKGTYYKSIHLTSFIKICLAYPNIYHLGMSNLGFQTIYSLLNQREDIICERTFLPTVEEEKEILRKNLPLFSLESKKPVFEFDILAFSLSFETDYLNILKILDLSKISLFSNQRDEHQPVVCAGGILTLINLEPISPFFDFFVIGEGEEIISEAIEIYKENSKRKFSKKNFLLDLSKIEGIYIPSFYHFEYSKSGAIKKIIRKEKVKEKIKKRWVKNIENFSTTTSIITKNTEFKNSYIVELTRGCPYSCKFCVEGHSCNPYRVRSLKNVLSLIEKGLKYTDNIGLLGAAISSYPYLQDLLKYLTDKKVKLQVSSLRIDKINKNLIYYLKNLGVKTITLGAETVSERLLKIIDKRITVSNIQEAISLCNDSEVETIKLYFMLGLPEEEIKDVKLLSEFLNNLKFKNKIIVNITPFVPKPNTLFEYCAFEDTFILKKRIEIIKEGIKNKKNITLKIESPRISLIQAVLSRGDRRLANVLFSIYKENLSFKSAMRKENLLIENYIAKRSEKEIFPWEIIDVGPTGEIKELLRKVIGEK